MSRQVVIDDAFAPHMRVTRTGVNFSAQFVLKPVVSEQFSLTELRSTWDALESRSTVGKLLLVP